MTFNKHLQQFYTAAKLLYWQTQSTEHKHVFTGQPDNIIIWYWPNTDTSLFDITQHNAEKHARGHQTMVITQFAQESSSNSLLAALSAAHRRVASQPHRWWVKRGLYIKLRTSLWHNDRIIFSAQYNSVCGQTVTAFIQQISANKLILYLPKTIKEAKIIHSGSNKYHSVHSKPPLWLFLLPEVSPMALMPYTPTGSPT